MTVPNPLASHLAALSEHPFIPELHEDDCADTACVACPYPTRVERLAAIAARVEAATKGPWFADDHEIYADELHDVWIGETCNVDEPVASKANGAFMAHSRADVPWLLAEVARLAAEVEALETGLGLNEEAPQTVARGLSAKEAVLRLMADTSPVPANANLFALAADKERGAVIAAAQAEAGEPA